MYKRANDCDRWRHLAINFHIPPSIRLRKCVQSRFSLQMQLQVLEPMMRLFYGGKNLRKIPLPLSRPSNQLSVIITLKKIKIYSKSIALSLREIDDV